MRRVIYTSKAPKPVGPYSQGIIAGNYLFVSGQIPIDPETGEVIKGDFKTQVRRVLENIKAIVEASGASMKDVVKVTVYLKDMNKFREFNEIYKEYFKEEPPARSVVEVSNLPKNVDLEIDAIVYIK